MIKDNQKLLNRFYILIDAIIIATSFAISYYLRFESPFFSRLRFFALPASWYYYPLAYYLRFLIYLIPGYLLIYYFIGLYNPIRSRGLRDQLWGLIKSNIVGLAYLTFILYFVAESDFSRKFIGVYFCVNTFFEFLFRYILRSILTTARQKGFNQKHVLLVGYSRTAEKYIDRILANPWWGYHIHGILDDNITGRLSYRGTPVLGSTEQLNEILVANDFDEIIITLSINEYEKLEDLVKSCEKSGVHTKFIPDYNDMIPTQGCTEDLEGLTMINIRNVPLSNLFNKSIKRLMDLFGALVALVIFAIPMILVSIMIKATSPGPLIFSQVRVGLHNKEFKMYKFRSMEVQSEAVEKKAWTTRNDPRVTTIGKFIRKTSIDELPQLFNILKGEMSLIGPRPERTYFVEKFKEEIPRYMIKHQVRPGLTGWAQVNGYRGDTSIRKRIQYDLYYIEHWTLGLDIKILFLTFFRGFVNKNAY